MAQKGAKKTPKLPRNSEIAPGISRFSAGRIFHKRGLWKKLEKPLKKAEVAPKSTFTETKKVGGAKNGGERVVPKRKTSRLLPQVGTKPRHNQRKAKTPKLRASITPGTVLIVLAGRHRGKRVVFLKQLESGLLLVSGPLRFNGTPLRRIAQAFVIATQTKVDISSVQVPETLNDEYFKRTTEKKPKAEGEIFAETKTQYTVTDQRKKDQKTVDAALIAAIKKSKDAKFLRSYLATPFSIQKGDRPHQLVF
ncbi:unnamed protein product [Bursaphelenchus okinawaensis]|uniref:Large ribosomal subunit protein eL6 n=1 Tax=Bursaphelenchus okinawaensis TaxID=465554 RepID=A0A811JQE7_9BILA|nr:unnamed protein product [Bursaphelenchus okinawaensis]CAG9078014.1 unnamed protein product [Bursaphelenchus okinawaensis]